MNGFQELNLNELYQIEGGGIRSWLRRLKERLLEGARDEVKPVPQPKPMHPGVGIGEP